MIRKLLIPFFVFAFAALVVGIVQAQESPEDVAAKHGITFPIGELGGCASYSECRNFCEDPVNQSTCISFAKSKGFHKEEAIANDNVLAAAKSQLGCDSIASCQSFCEVPANHVQCSSFAQSADVTGGYVTNPGEAQILNKAKEVLGCDSAQSCSSICSDPANHQKCSDFAHQAGLAGGERHVGPGGCTSPESCQSFCSDPNNYQLCSGFASSSGGKFSGPGGCDSESSCRSYCENNPQACGGFGTPGIQPPGYNPQDMCNKTPNCSWAGNSCACGFYGETKESQQKAGEYAAFCSSNPDKCTPGQTGGFGSSEQRGEFEKFCQDNPEKCKPPTGGTSATPDPGGYPGYTPSDPATQCSRYGCTWTGSSCQCQGHSGGTYTDTTSETYPPQPGYSPPPGYTPPPGGGYTPQPGYSPPPGGYSPPPIYSYPSPSGPSYSPSPYSYPSPGSYSYPTPGSYSYPSPSTPGYSYPSPSYGTPAPYGTPEYGTPAPYGTPEYSTPPPYGTPEYTTPPPYSYPTPVQGVSREATLFDQVGYLLRRLFGN